MHQQSYSEHEEYDATNDGDCSIFKKEFYFVYHLNSPPSGLTAGIP